MEEMKDSQKGQKEQNAPGITDGGGKAVFRTLSRKQKLQYLWDYEKLPILGILVLILIVGSFALRAIRKKQVLLSAAIVNVQISDDTRHMLSEDYTDLFPGGSRKNMVQLHTNLLLTPADADADTSSAGDMAADTAAAADTSAKKDIAMSSQSVDGALYEYAYASSLKLLALMTDRKLDVVLMDPEACEQFSRNDYLMDLSDIDGLQEYQGSLTLKGDALSLDGSTLADTAHFSGDVLIGIIQNTQRQDAAVQYIRYCMSSPAFIGS